DLQEARQERSPRLRGIGEQLSFHAPPLWPVHCRQTTNYIRLVFFRYSPSCLRDRAPRCPSRSELELETQSFRQPAWKRWLWEWAERPAVQRKLRNASRIAVKAQNMLG